MAANMPVRASGNIGPRKFIAGVSGTRNTVVQAVAANQDNLRVLGVSRESTKEAPIPPVTNTYHAEDTDPVGYYQWGEECLVEAGAAVTAFEPCMPDANGDAIPATTGKYAVFMPFEDAADGEYVKGVVMSPTVAP